MVTCLLLNLNIQVVMNLDNPLVGIIGLNKCLLAIIKNIVDAIYSH